MSDSSSDPATRGDVETAVAASEQRLLRAIAESEARTTEKIAESEARTTAAIAASQAYVIQEIGAAVAHTATVVLEHNRELFRLATDKTSAVEDQVTALAARVDDHIADDTRHRTARRRR
jgi:hypothetical protein